MWRAVLRPWLFPRRLARSSARFSFFHFLLGHPLCVVRGDSVWTPRHDLCKRLCVAVLTSLLCSACGTVLLSVFPSSLYLPFQK